MLGQLAHVLTAAAAAAVGPSLRVGGALGEVNPAYASWNVDGSWNRGFFHVKWTNANLRAAAASLQPSSLRFGGGGNDFIKYDAPPGSCSAKGNQDRGPPLPPGYNCLNASHFAEFYGMANHSGAQLIFGLSFDKVAACAEHQKYAWNSSNAVAWIRHMQTAGQDVWAYELGNEVNNQGIRPDGSPDAHNCSILPESQAQAIESLAQELETLYPDAATRPLLIGPDTGGWFPQSWLNSTLKAVGHRLHAVTHHVYLGVSKKSFNSGRKLDSALADDISWYLPIVRAHAPAAQVWAGEDGPTGGGDSGTCGSDADSICGLYGTVLWYAADMGLRAQHSFKQYQRQDLVGGRYSLVGMPHDNEFLSEADAVTLHADFWVNFLWKRLMGPTVLNTSVSGGDADPESDGPSVRGYAHCGTAPSPFRPNATGGAPPLTVLLVNLDNSNTSTEVTIDGAASLVSWTISPATGKGGGPFGARALLNGKLLPRVIADGEVIGRVPVAGVQTVGGKLSLPPISVTFAMVEGLPTPPECQQ